MQPDQHQYQYFYDQINNSQQIIASGPSDEPSFPPGVASALQKYFFSWILLADIWITIGRGFFGSAGWGTLVMLLSVAPIIFVYGIIISVIAGARNKKTGYTFSTLAKSVAISLLSSLFLLGFTYVDGGDTAESGRSVLTNIFGINFANGESSFVMALSETLSSVSSIAIVVLGVTLLVLVCVERRESKNKSVPPNVSGSVST